MRRALVASSLFLVGGFALADVIVEVPKKAATPPPTAEIIEGARAKDLPPGVRIDGTPVARAAFVDASGEHVVVVSVTDVKTTAAKDDDEDPTAEKHLFGWHFAKAPATKAGAPSEWKLVWQTKDWVKDCAFDLYVDYVPGSLEVTDLDRDGTFETLFAYRMTCTSDVSPMTLKLLMHEGATKYAVRGTTRVQVGTDGDDERPVFEGGAVTPDDAFKRAPKSFVEHALMRFRLFADQSPW